MNIRKSVILFISLLILSSCGRPPEIKYFSLYYDLPENISTQKDGRNLYIQQFTADPIYNTSQFIYRPSKYEYEFDYYRRWAVAPVEMLTTQALEHFRASDAFNQVSLEPFSGESYFVLSVTIKKFEEIYNGARNANIALYMELREFDQDVFIISKLYEAIAPISAAGEKGIIEAMSQGTKEIFNSFLKDLKIEENKFERNIKDN